MRRGHLIVRLASTVLPLLAALAAGLRGQTAPTGSPSPSGVELLQDLRSFRELGSVLYIAAHPDD